MTSTEPLPAGVTETKNRIYVGTRCSRGNPHVTVNGRPLDPRPSQKVWNHSPNGFEWGYGGSGPAQLALAILLDATDGNSITALDLYQAYKFSVVAGWPKRGWVTTRQAVLKWVAERLCPFPPPDLGGEGGGA